MSAVRDWTGRRQNHRLHWRTARDVRAAIIEASEAIADFSRRHGGWLPPIEHEERMRQVFSQRDRSSAKHRRWQREHGFRQAVRRPWVVRVWRAIVGASW